MKVICIHHRLAGYTSHHFNEAWGLMRELGRRRRKLVLLVNIHAPREIVAQLHARAVFDDPTFRQEWSFEERSARFVAQLHAHVDRLVKRDDCVLITVSTQLEAHALTQWLEALPARRKPWVVVLMISDRWNRYGRKEYERQLAEFGTLEASIAGLKQADANRLIFCTLTEPLSRELQELLGVPVSVAPVPLEYAEPRASGSFQLAALSSQEGRQGLRADNWPASRLRRVAILGGLRREKGSYLIPDIIKACRALVPVEFLVHLTNNDLSAEELEKLASIVEEPDVSVIRDAVPLPEYEAALGSADIALFPYEEVPYRKRISGVCAEAIAIGKPVVATPGTWMAKQIDAGRAAGVIAEDFHPDSIARAVARCVADLEPLRRSAEALAPEWRRTNSLTAFVDFVDAQIASRAEPAAPRRWFGLTLPVRKRWW